MKNKIFILIAFTLFIVSFITIAFHNLQFPYLDYDEAGQFYISCGLTHDSAYGTPMGGIFDFIESNRHYNLDPGGFGLFLRLWSSIIGYTPFSLRLLPLLFFTIALVLIYKLAKEELKDTFLSIITIAALIRLPIFQLAFYVRPYSMEMLGCIGAIVIWLRTKNNLDIKHLFLLSIWLGLFSSSRYGFILTAFAISLRVIYVLINGKINNLTTKKTLFKIGAYCLPLLFSILLIFFMSTIFQAKKIGYCIYLWEDPKYLYYPMALTFYVFIIISLLMKHFENKLSESHIASLFVVSVFFIASCLNKYPWDEVRTISVTLLLGINILIMILKLLLIRSGNTFLRYVFPVGFIVLLWLIPFYKVVTNKPDFWKEYELLRLDEKFRNANKVYVCNVRNPELRYQYEYGIYKKYCSYDGFPEKFILQNTGWHTQVIKEGDNVPQRIDLDSINCDYYVFCLPEEKNNPKYIRYKNYEDFYVPVENNCSFQP